MALDNKYPNRKDQRRAYFKSKRFDRSCRPGGSCPYCRDNRLCSSHRREAAAKDQIDEFLDTGS